MLRNQNLMEVLTNPTLFILLSGFVTLTPLFKGLSNYSEINILYKVHFPAFSPYS